MEQSTQRYKRSFSGSIGAGMGSIMGGSRKQYYILEHKVSSKYHKAGESQEIIVDQIELGRDSKCQVRFDESFETVSRRHAAIVRDRDRWKLVQLSDTNPTFLNGKPVQREWYLQSGDEIQLSERGPRLGFIVPTGNKATIGSIGLSRRLSLFRQQALKPYKTAITVMSVVLCLVVAGAGAWGWFSYQKQEELMANNQEMAGKIVAISKDSQEKADSLSKELIRVNEQMDSYKKEMYGMMKKVKNVAPSYETSASGSIPIGEISTCNPYVYAIFIEKIEIEFQGETHTIPGESSFTGTGFLLEDGLFVTARHVTEPWYYYEYTGSTDHLLMNVYANNDGKVVAHYSAISNSGDKFYFTSNNFKYDRSTDKIGVEKMSNGRSVVVKKAVLDYTDWASYKLKKTEGLKYNANLSENLPQGATLEILGFPQRMGLEDINHIEPIYYTCRVARQGLDENGTIMASNDESMPGNSGGPVFLKFDDVYQVVGIVSGVNKYSKGRFVPISAIK